jgi:hypothetical protein
MSKISGLGLFLNFPIVSGTIYGFVAGLGLSMIYALAGLIIVDLVQATFPIFLIFLIFGSATILVLAIIPAALYGTYTGLILGVTAELLGSRISRGAYVLLSLMICVGIAVLTHLVFRIPVVLSFESLPPSFTRRSTFLNIFLGFGPGSLAPYDSYLFWIGLPTIIYLFTGGWIGSRLYNKRQRREGKMGSPTRRKMVNVAHLDKFVRIEYPTIYEDRNGQERVKIVHKHLAPGATLSGTLNYTELCVMVRGVRFSIYDFEEFELDEPQNALSNSTFTFKERQGRHILWDCCFQVDIPIQIFVDSKTSMATLRVITQLGEKSDKDGFSLSLNLICAEFAVSSSALCLSSTTTARSWQKS